MRHLEALISEYLEWQGYFIRRNTKVGRLSHGGWEMELDVVGFHPETQDLVHYEPSIDAATPESLVNHYPCSRDCGGVRMKASDQPAQTDRCRCTAFGAWPVRGHAGVQAPDR